MATGTSTRERKESPSEERVIELVDARRQHSLRYNYKLFQRLQSFYNTYRGVWQGKNAQFRNNITIPFTFAMITRDVAQKVQTSFGVWPIVSFEGYAPEDVSIAKKRETLISAQMKDCKSVLKAADFYLQADICGTGVARYGWKNITRKQRIRKNETIAPGMTIPVMYEYDAEMFNGPNWEVVDRLDFWQQPGKTRIEDMAWVIHRYWADMDDLMDDANSPYPYFDKAAISRLKAAPLSESGERDWNARRLAFRNEFDYSMRINERFAKPVEIWEMHGLVPEEFAKNGVRDRCIAIGNGRVVLKNRESILPSGKKMFESYAPMPDPYGFDGIGKAEVAFGPQLTADRLNNQKLDAIDQLIDPMWIASSQSGIGTQNLFTRAGRIVLVDGPADETNLRALVPNMNGLQAAYTEINQLWQFMQLGAGLNDVILGMQAQGERETARGVLTRQENVMTRLAFEAHLAEEGFLEPLANDFVELDRMFLPTPYQVKVLGSSATINPVTGLPYPQERMSIDPDDLVPDYRARAQGASQTMGKNVKQQNWMTLLQIMSSNPAFMQMVNWAAFARQTFELFDFKNVDELLVNTVPMTNMLAAQTGQSPEAIAGMASSGMTQLDPQIIGQMFNSQAAA